MHSAGARVLREDDYEMNADREAVLSAWEQKALIDEPPLRSRRFQRADQGSPTESEDRPANVVALPERRTVTITGQPTPRPRRQSTCRSSRGTESA